MSEYSVSSNLAISENGFLFHPGTGESFTLNETAKRMLDELKKGTSPEDIVSIIVNEYDVDRGNAEMDFTDFLNQLKNFNLVKEL